MSRTIILSDIHGCLLEFQELVAKLRLTPADRVVCLGDFMDKGPDPVGCVRFARTSGFSSVTGNHEERHLRWRTHEDRRAAALQANLTPKKNPMKPLGEKQAAENAALSAEDVTWLRSLPIMMVVKGINLDRDWVIVHGGLMPGLALEDQTDDRLRLRQVNTLTGKMHPVDLDKPNDMPPGVKWWMEVYDRPEHVVYGHAAHGLSEPRVDRNALGAECWGIDTGCVYGGSLSGFVLETKELVQVRARTIYCAPSSPLTGV